MLMKLVETHTEEISPVQRKIKIPRGETWKVE